MTPILDRLWPTPPAYLALTSQEVHVWRASLDQAIPLVQDLRGILTADELSRSAQFRVRRDRHRFCVAHGLLRMVLSLYVDTEPGQLRFCTGEHGKPALFPVPGRKRISFNLSHSDRLVLYAVALGREVGVDVERVRPLTEMEQIVARLFSVRERTVFQALPVSSRQQAFYNCWTRKEAYLKARGEGLSLPLDQFDVSLAPGQPALLLDVPIGAPEVSQWSLRELEPGPGYVAALAVEGHDWRLSCWQFPQFGQYAGTRLVREAPV